MEAGVHAMPAMPIPFDTFIFYNFSDDGESLSKYNLPKDLCTWDEDWSIGSAY